MASKQIGPSYDQTGDIALKNQDSLRKLVGVLGMLLPLALYLFLQVDENFSLVLPSISHYYYTRGGTVFIIIMSLLAIFLLIYKGEERKDYYISSIAGIAALLVVLFPTNNLQGLHDGQYNTVSATWLRTSDFRPKFHYISAAVFLLSLAYMSFFLFTKSDQAPSKRPKTKIRRNRIYRTCAVIMVLAIAVIVLGFLKVINESYYDAHNLTFWMEVVAVEAFGFSWMVKGNAIIKDKNASNKSA